MADKVGTFDADEFRAIYPKFENLSDATLEWYFQVACQLCNNTAKSPIKDLDERKILLYMLVCHIATLQERGSGIVGPMTNASEGGVSAGFGSLGKDQNWYTQTQCGAMYWSATAKYRVGMRYYAYCGCKNSR